MVYNPDNIKPDRPVCYFCGEPPRLSSMFRQNTHHIVLVQASDEKPKEAQLRRVCEGCDPKR